MKTAQSLIILVIALLITPAYATQPPGSSGKTLSGKTPSANPNDYCKALNNIRWVGLPMLAGGVPISSGVCIIHVQVPDVGEKTLKWFGTLRPVDLEAF